MKYSFEKKNAAGESFKVDGCDSFDEAIRKVEKGIADREATLAEAAKKDAPPAAKQEVPPAKPDMVEKYDADGNVIK